MHWTLPVISTTPASTSPSWRHRNHRGVNGTTHAILTACRPYGTVVQIHPRVDHPHHTDVITLVLITHITLMSSPMSWRPQYRLGAMSTVLASTVPFRRHQHRRDRLTYGGAASRWCHQQYHVDVICLPHNHILTSSEPSQCCRNHLGACHQNYLGVISAIIVSNFTTRVGYYGWKRKVDSRFCFCDYYYWLHPIKNQRSYMKVRLYQAIKTSVNYE